MRSMGGDIVFETDEGVGSIFRVRVPLASSSSLRSGGTSRTRAMAANARLVN